MADNEHANDGLNEPLLKAEYAEGAGTGGAGATSDETSAEERVESAEERTKNDDASSTHGAAGSDAGSTASGTPSAHGAGTAARVALQHKKFSASNINQQWRQKASGPSTATHSAPHPVAVKAAAGPVAKPTPIAPTQSRLVTAKLTALPPSASPAGWSRPSSAASPAAFSPAPGAASANGNAPGAPAPTGVGTLSHPHGGKTTDLQTRLAPTAGGPAPVGANKPAWRNVQPARDPTASDNDFPTAAEVAQGRVLRDQDRKEVEQAHAAQQHVLQEQADAFRGVHLNPNAHHWDEMEEDGDNFLDDVIDFGDGRQYKVAESPVTAVQPGHLTERTFRDGEGPKHPEGPVSKEERFQEDFDRSWPRSREHARHQFAPRDAPPHASLPPAQAGSRALFNERLNKLEPYASNHVPSRPAAPSAGHRDVVPSPTESRHSRDEPPHAQRSGMQLLQKSDPNVLLERRGQLSSGPSSRAWGQPPDRDLSRRDGLPALSPTSPRLPLQSPRDQRSPFQTAHSLSDSRFLQNGRESRPQALEPEQHGAGRQLPPHLAIASDTASAALQQPEPSIKSPAASEASAAPAPPAQLAPPAQSAPSAEPAPTPVPETAQEAPAPQAVTVIDYEAVSKAAMHTAAERARLRRQQEEEERARAQERARKKAAELEEKLKAEQAAKQAASQSQLAASERESMDATVVSIIEEAAKSAQVPNEQEPRERSSSFTRSTAAPPTRLTRPPSLRGDPRTGMSQPRPPARRLPSQVSTASEVSSPAMAVESWRSNAHPLPSAPATKFPTRATASESVPLPPPPLMDGLDSLSMKPGEDIEEVDFTELGKFMDADQQGDAPHEHRAQRPIASDFFEDSPTTASNDSATWRRHAPVRETNDHSAIIPPQGALPATIHATSQAKNLEVNAEASRRPAPLLPSSVPAKPPANGNHLHAHSHSQTTVPDGFSVQRSPRSATFRDASMTALDDAMSRIKGAIDGMHQETKPGSDDTPEHASLQEDAIGRPPVPQSREKTKWVPPALRSNPPVFKSRHHFEEPSTPREEFNVTQLPPPPSPKPAWNTFTVRLAKRGVLPEPVSKKQINLTKNAGTQVRWDILSFVPPVEGMTRRDLSVNDVLFKPQFFKGKISYKVRLPRPSPRIANLARTSGQGVGPRVNLPASNVGLKPGSNGAFGKPKSPADGASWRKPLSNTPVDDSGPSQEVLNPVSRSPPPELQRTGGATDSSEPPSVSTAETSGSRRNSQPKMPEGSSVAFYRDSRVATKVASTVNFTVLSELEDGAEYQQPDPAPTATRVDIDPPAASRLPSARIPLAPLPSRTEGAGSANTEGPSDTAPRQMDHKGPTDNSADSRVITPAAQPTSTWTKSPIAFPVKEMLPRGAEDERLKAVWSQASDKAGFSAANSLEKIGDDLTGLPFTLHDVKSEQGTPPPTSATSGPLRMSLSDVTRAFQQVPQSSGNPPAQNNATSSPSGNTSNQAQYRPMTSYPYGPPMPTGNLRPVYAPYGSPMLSSASPTMMYPPPVASSPAPRPMNGQTPYAPPLWMPVSSATAVPNGVMRPMPSPYAQPVMAYPAPGSPMYPQPGIHPPGTPIHAHGATSRGRGMPMGSPVVGHAHPPGSVPMYAGSPVLMQPPMGMTPNHSQSYPSPVSVARAPARPYDAPSAIPQAGHTPYAPATASFARPGW